MTVHSQTLEAVSLRQWPAGEADRIIAFFTREAGRRVARARGTRKPKSRLAAVLTPPSHLHVTIYEGQAMASVTGAQVIRGFVHLQDNLLRLAASQVLVEICDRAIPDGQAAEMAFDVFLAALAALDESESPLAALLRGQVGLLQSLGWGFSLEQCGRCGALLEELSYLETRVGGLTCARCGGNRRVRKEVRAALQVGSENRSVVAEAQAVLDLLWHEHLDRALRSTAFLLEILPEPAP